MNPADAFIPERQGELFYVKCGINNNMNYTIMDIFFSATVITLFLFQMGAGLYAVFSEEKKSKGAISFIKFIYGNIRQ